MWIKDEHEPPVCLFHVILVRAADQFSVQNEAQLQHDHQNSWFQFAISNHWTGLRTGLLDWIVDWMIARLDYWI